MTSALALSIALHTALGLALAGLVWLVGSGCLVLLRRPRDPRSLLDAYPLGLFVVMAAAVPPLLWRPLGVVSVVVVLAAVVIGARAARLPLGGGTLAVATLGSAAFGAGLGALLHGPTDDLDSAAYGGMLWYVAKVVSAAQSIVPFRDPLAEGETIIYSEAGTSFVGAVLSWLPGFDPILFQAATLPTFAAVSLCIGIALFVEDRPIPAPLVGIAAALLGVAIVPYPSWITETPPAAFALPLVFSIWRVWRDELDTRWLVVLSSVVALDYFQTKVVAIMALGLLLVAGLVERHRSRPDFRRVALIGAAVLALGAAAVIGLLFAFASWYAGLAKPKALPLDALRGLTDGDPDIRSLGLACLVAGEVVLLTALARARSWGLFVAHRRDRPAVVAPLGLRLRRRAGDRDLPRRTARAQRRAARPAARTRVGRAAGVRGRSARAARPAAGLPADARPPGRARRGHGQVARARPRGHRRGRGGGRTRDRGPRRRRRPRRRDHDRRPRHLERGREPRARRRARLHDPHGDRGHAARGLEQLSSDRRASALHRRLVRREAGLARGGPRSQARGEPRQC